MSENIGQLQERVNDLEDQLADLRTQIAEAQLDQWEGRVDDLDVQVHLAAMDTRDRLAPVVEQLRNRWLSARERVSDATEITSDFLSSLRADFVDASSDVRTTIRDTLDKVGK